jgi:hypothetical protein
MNFNTRVVLTNHLVLAHWGASVPLLVATEWAEPHTTLFLKLHGRIMLFLDPLAQSEALLLLKFDFIFNNGLVFVNTA